MPRSKSSTVLRRAEKPPERSASVAALPQNGSHSTLSKRDIRITFPGSDRIRVHSPALFSDPHSDFSRQFIERAFLAHEVETVEIEGAKKTG